MAAEKEVARSTRREIEQRARALLPPADDDAAAATDAAAAAVCSKCKRNF